LCKTLALSAPLVVLTGGEPTVYPLEDLCRALRHRYSCIALETNGTKPLELLFLRNAGLVNWITVSPKPDHADRKAVELADELKVVLADGVSPHAYARWFGGEYKFVQPCSENFKPAIDFVKRYPNWRLSVQVQKLIKVP